MRTVAIAELVGHAQPEWELVAGRLGHALREHRNLFLDMLGQAAELSGRTIQILEQRGQASDHPVSASCLEAEYLKCVIARVL